jgi:hypothetical protein
MENKINWDRKDYWNEYNIYDECFISFHLDHVGLDENKWNELVKKYGLKTVVYEESGGGNGDVSVHNDDYSIVISANNCGDVPCYYLMLTLNKNIDMSTFIRFYRDFSLIIDHCDDLTVREGITGEFTDHRKEIIKTMIEKL